MAEPPSSPPSGDTSTEDALSWYKSQYEQLEHELVEFRESSRELEAELEKDLDAADKRERGLRDKAEALQYEVDEWKKKYKESKSEANAAQNTLEKEITTLRDANRTLQLRLRDTEVANDDFERQARNTTSSLEDLESKYNVAIERGVLLEEEIKIGEQERESLRVDAQRLREELSDLKIEAEILQAKLAKQQQLQEEAEREAEREAAEEAAEEEAAAARARQHHLSAISTDLSVLSVPESPTFDHSPNSTASSPLITTPPDAKALSLAGSVADAQELAMSSSSPPSMLSEAAAKAAAVSVSKPLRKQQQPKPFAPVPPLGRTPGPIARKSRLPSPEFGAGVATTTPRPKALSSSISSTSGARPLGSRVATAAATTRTPSSRTAAAGAAGNGMAVPKSVRATSHKLPSSNSLSHIRSLTAQMQRLEARVQSARSKLPAPINTPPRSSPRTLAGGAGGGSSGLPSTVTIRSRKRTVGSAASSVVSGYTAGSGGEDATPTPVNHISRPAGGKHVPRLSTSGVSRLSFGPLPNRGGGGVGGVGGGSSQIESESSRPSSRASVSSYARPASRNADARDMPPPRPMSRTSLSGARTPLGRPRSSLGSSLHGHSMSMSMGMGMGVGMNGSIVPEDDMVDSLNNPEFRTPSRRGTYSKYELEAALNGGASGIPAPSGIPMPGSRRQSGANSALGFSSVNSRRASTSTK
ncbi:NADH:ubiquinone oxidoreductase [Sporothrix curviconia]|uniref:NADH:ubiquinone oxidoreductase n=1 Tax=Sporothrix curviconia TaxID=1260050 RepID=A0ABP0BAL0_9PEZI